MCPTFRDAVRLLDSGFLEWVKSFAVCRYFLKQLIRVSVLLVADTKVTHTQQKLLWERGFVSEGNNLLKCKSDHSQATYRK